MKSWTLIKAIRRGFAAAQEAPPAQHFKAADKIIVCSHCGSDGFAKAGLFGLTYAGYGLRCCRCSHLEYFGKNPPTQV